MTKGQSDNVLRIMLAILLRPGGIFLTFGIGVQFRINILPAILDYISGIVGAVWIIARRG